MNALNHTLQRALGVACRSMCFRLFCTILATLLLALSIGFGDDQRPAATLSPLPLSRAGLGALEHASKLVAAINALDWKAAEAFISPKDPFLELLKRDASAQKEWPGIGAYRGSDFDPERRTLRHRFAYGPTRTTPHEVWFNYSVDGDEFTFDSMMFLGW